MSIFPNTDENALYNFNAIDATLHVPNNLILQYKNSNPWKQFGSIICLEDGGDNATKCGKPIISYSNGTLSYNCETENVDYITTIKNTDVNTYSGSTVKLSVKYEISVVATKVGLEDSDEASATLCWIDQEPRIEGVESIAQISAYAVLIQNNNGLFIISGVDAGTPIEVYDVSGALIDRTMSHGNTITINPFMSIGSMAIVKIGKKAVKMLVK